MDKTTVLIVDDSRVFRSIVEHVLKPANDIEVAGSVWSGEKALEFLEQHPVDLVTLDIEMPGMNGLETLRHIQEFNQRRQPADPVGVLMLSAHTQRGADTTMQALEAGAFDFIAKPRFDEGDDAEDSLRRQMLTKIRCWATRKTSHAPALAGLRRWTAPAVAPEDRGMIAAPVEAVVIGVSTGGPKALTEMLPNLCRTVACPILIVQHMPPGFTKSLADGLAKKCSHEVVEAQDNMPVRGRKVFIAPGDHHLLVRREGKHVFTSLNDQPPEQGHRPSVDILFRSAAMTFGDKAIAIILTGMGSDGAASLRPLKRAGARIIAQDQESSVVWGMPGAAVQTGLVDMVAPLSEVPAAVDVLLRQTPGTGKSVG